MVTCVGRSTFWQLQQLTDTLDDFFDERLGLFMDIIIGQAELLDNVALNLHRIDKDVQRCDRHYWYFSDENLEKLRNIMCTSVPAYLHSYDYMFCFVCLFVCLCFFFFWGGGGRCCFL